jgi:hypothetical protein
MKKNFFGGGLRKPQDVIAYYPLDGNADDFFGHFNGIEVDNTNYTTGLVGQAYDGLNGVNSFIKLPDDDVFSFTDGTNDLPFSISVWLKKSNLQTGYIFNKGVGGQLEYQFLYFQGSIIFRLNDYRNNSNQVFRQIAYSINLDPTTWYNIVVTYDGLTLKMYVNDTSVGTNSENGTYIGMVNGTDNPLISRGTTHFDGLIDEFIIYNRELTASEVTDIYNKGLAGIPLY